MSSPSTLEAIRAAAKAELAAAPTVRSWWVDAALVIGVSAVMTAMGLGLMPWSTGQHASVLARWGTLGLMLFVAVAGALLAVRPSRSAVSRMVMLALGAASAVLTVVGGSGAGSDAPLDAGLACARTECLMTLLPLGVALFVLTRFAFDPLRAVVLGVACGAPGLAVLHVHCPSGAVAHLALMHVAPWVAMAAVCVVVRRWLPSRSVAP